MPDIAKTKCIAVLDVHNAKPDMAGAIRFATLSDLIALIEGGSMVEKVRLAEVLHPLVTKLHLYGTDAPEDHECER